MGAGNKREVRGGEWGCLPQKKQATIWRECVERDSKSGGALSNFNESASREWHEHKSLVRLMVH